MLHMATASQSKLDVTKLKELARGNDLAHTVFRALESRERPRPVTDLRRLRQELIKTFGLAVNNDAYLSVFSSIQKAGAGALKVSKDPTVPPRFEWSHNHIELAREVLGITSSQKAARSETLGGARGIGFVPSGWHLMPIKIRGRVIHVEVPEDLKEAEAERSYFDPIRRFTT
jgi:hypothetical protein